MTPFATRADGRSVSSSPVVMYMVSVVEGALSDCLAGAVLRLKFDSSRKAVTLSAAAGLAKVAWVKVGLLVVTRRVVDLLVLQWVMNLARWSLLPEMKSVIGPAYAGGFASYAGGFSSLSWPPRSRTAT